MLNNFTSSRQEILKVADHTWPAFSIRADVPQGSALSTNLYSICTNDKQGTAMNCMHVQQADDIMENITYQGRSRRLMARKTAQVLDKINKCEKKEDKDQ